MVQQLVQVTDEHGATSWVRASTGEVVTRQQKPAVRAPVSDMLYEAEPLIWQKLNEGKPLSWYELSRASDVVLRAVSQDSLHVMFQGASMRQIKAAIETMLMARRLVEKLDPLSNPSAGRDLTSSRAKSAAEGTMKALLTLPG